MCFTLYELQCNHSLGIRIFANLASVLLASFWWRRNLQMNMTGMNPENILFFLLIALHELLGLRIFQAAV